MNVFIKIGNVLPFWGPHPLPLGGKGTYLVHLPENVLDPPLDKITFYKHEYMYIETSTQYHTWPMVYSLQNS